MKNVLSMQSAVAYGHVGNTAAALPLQRLGVEVWPVDTARLSNHTGHATWRGGPVDAAAVAEVIDGIDALGVLGECDALLTGYLGDTAVAEVAAGTLARLRRANGKALYLCDPVMGSAARGFYVAAGVPEFVRDVLAPRADIVTPNRFELEFLARRPVAGPDDARAAADAVRELGPGIVVCTSLESGDGGDGIATLAADGEGAWLVRTPRIDAAANGAGDVLAALFLGHLLRGAGTGDALSRSVSAVHAVLAATAAAGSRELALVQAQDAFAAPPTLFPAEPLG